jgi:HSP20 family molecular chaperone IbpA
VIEPSRAPAGTVSAACTALVLQTLLPLIERSLIMALPVRLSRRQQGSDLSDLARNDFTTVLNRLFTRGLLADVDETGALAPMMNYGVDIREDADHVYIEADLPGFRKEDVDIQIEDGTLTIIAEHREEVQQPSQQQQQPSQGTQQQGQGVTQQQEQGQQQQQERGGRQQRQQQQQEPAGEYLLHERRIQRYVRSFTLPPNVNDQHVEARLEDGVLKITLNKREESKPRKIRVA